MWAALLPSLLSCSGGPAPAVDDTSPPADTGEPPLEFRFSFAVFADPHLTTSLDHEERLAAAVDWVNQAAGDRGIGLVFVVGDIGWGGGLEIAKGLLDALDVPYVPVIGDNEIHFGDEANFDAVFEPQYDLLSRSMEGWRRGAVEAYDAVRSREVWLQNFSFNYGGLRMVGLDWCSRDDNDWLSELAELNAYEDGTFPFFTEEVEALEAGALEAGAEEDVLLFSHHPMMLAPFGEADMAEITGLTGPVSHRIAAAYAGHFHVDYTGEVEEGGYEVYITDAIWDDVVTVRLVSVHGNGERYVYEQELVIVE